MTDIKEARGLEVVASLHQHFDGRRRVQVPNGVYDQDAGWGAKVEPLCRLSDATAVIDQLLAELAALKAKAAVPVGWRVEPIYDNGVDGFIVGTPRVGGVRTNTSVFPDDDDPAHSLLAIMLAAAPAQPQSDGVLMPVSDVEEYISLLIDEADAHLHGRHQPEMQAHMRAEIERVRALLGGEA